MDLGGSKSGSFFIVSIAGKIDRLKDSIVLKSFLNTALEKGDVNIAINLSKVTYLDSGALNVLIYGHNAAAKKGGTLVLIEPNEYVNDVLSVAGLDQMVKIYPNEKDFTNAIKTA